MQKINYISGPPGLGKTRWAVIKIAHLLRREEQVFYVAPTVNLLTQVANEVFKELRKLGDSPSQARARLLSVYGESKTNVPSRVQHRILSSLTGEPIAGSKLVYDRFTPGTMMLLTHAGFSTVQMLNLDPKILASVYLIYDEARKMVLERRPIKFSEAQLRRFNNLFVKKQYRDTTYYRLKFKKGLTTDKAIAKLGVALGLFRQSALLLDLLDSIGNPALETFVSAPEVTKNTKYYVTSMPARTFYGFKEVTLMAAYFEDSQMYSLLKKSKTVRLKNITKQLPGYKTRLAKIRRKYSNVNIIPITNSNTLLSLRTLNGVMVKGNTLTDVARYVYLNNVSNSDLTYVGMSINRGLALGGRDATSLTNLKNLILQQEGVVTNPIEWYLQRAVIILNDVRNSLDDRKPLLFVNNAFRKDTDSLPLERISMISHGLNNYSDRSEAVFLAAINPNRHLAGFLQARLGSSYNQAKDFVLDICVQSICRTNVRNVDCTLRTDIIVPDLAMAQMLQERLGKNKKGEYLAHVDTQYMEEIHPLRMSDLNKQLPEDIQEKIKQQRLEKAEKRKRDAKERTTLPMNKVFAAWTVQKSRAQKTMQESPEREAARIQRLDQLQKAFKEARSFLADAPMEVQQAAADEARGYPRIEVFSEKCRPQNPVPLLVYAGLQPVPKDLSVIQGSVFATLPFENRPKKLPSLKPKAKKPAKDTGKRVRKADPALGEQRFKAVYKKEKKRK